MTHGETSTMDCSVMQYIGLAPIQGLMPFFVWQHGGAMEIVNFPDVKYDKIGATGECPHCKARAYFRPVANHLELASPKDSNGPQCTQRAACACQCEGCKGFILVVGIRDLPNSLAFAPFKLLAVYPLGTPNEQVGDGVPSDVADDFKEAQRCYFIRAYKATVIMCRRALQSSADEQQAKGATLQEQINDLHTAGKITKALQEFAHHLRMTGNKGAHSDVGKISADDALDMLQFTQQYLDHVYIMPAKLKARQSRPIA